MKIGCLQFSPQVGEIDNNLNRADSVLNRADATDLNDLDLLVLPELAFTGYNFKSLREISPFLEPSTAGISALWARTTALKHNCTVAVGYPEKVDITSDWPTSPRYYNSLLVVNEDGDTVANYRKSFLYYTDETWALEGEGFFEDEIPGFGRVAMGICMDINPYKFEAPWHAFEFAFHVLEVEANLVIISMAWLSREESRTFSRFNSEPDMETLTYWTQRLEPLIRAEQEEEIIVVFANRCGIEDDAVYAGTSAVIGIRNGEVNVYGLLGRGEKELLVVDTESPPFAKLVHRPDRNSKELKNDEAPRPDIEKIETPISPNMTFSRPSSEATSPVLERSGAARFSGGSNYIHSPTEEWKPKDVEDLNIPAEPAGTTQDPRHETHAELTAVIEVAPAQPQNGPTPEAEFHNTAGPGTNLAPASPRSARTSKYFSDVNPETPPLSEPDKSKDSAPEAAIPRSPLLPSPDEPHTKPLKMNAQNSS